VAAKKNDAVAAAPSVPMPAKASNGKLSPSDFIRSLPSSKTAKQVQDEGAAHGLKFSAALVYAVRRAQAKRGAKARAPRAAKTAPVAAAKATTGHSSHHGEFRKLMIRIGLDQAEALYADVHRELKAIEDRN
jgi:hypothetical protein